MAEESGHARLAIPTVSSRACNGFYSCRGGQEKQTRAEDRSANRTATTSYSWLNLLREFAPGCWENQARGQLTSEISVLGSAREDLGFQTRGVWVSNWKGHTSLAIVEGQGLNFKVEVGTESQLAGG